ncbi:hypothetical protein KBB25_00990, partial [Candidatus Gracilibacteria bacterium]|nr:hypothetical protein [Candidatus Gracilibacteria bacterium]
MKKLLSLLSVCVFLIGSFGASVLAADTAQKIHHFTIIAPPTTKVGQAIDIKVEARDKDDKIIPSYNGSVYFQSTTDFGATLPAQGKSVQFKTSDNGAITISKAIIFKRAGSQTLTVTETIEDADGSVTIKVDPADDTTGSGSNTAETISIITPDNNSTITNDTVTVSGKTKKNSKISIKLNGKEVATVLSDDTGIYTKSLTDLTQSSNIISASVLDGNNTVIGTAESKFGVATDGPQLIGTSVTPTSVTTGDTVTITTEADPGLSDLSFILDGSSIKATEKSSGKYSADTVAPAKAGTYPIGITAKSS